MTTPKVLAHHPFPGGEEVEGCPQLCRRDLVLGHQSELIMGQFRSPRPLGLTDVGLSDVERFEVVPLFVSL